MTDEAITQEPMWFSENVEDGIWSVTFYFGKGDDACKAMRKFADGVRTPSSDLQVSNLVSAAEAIVEADTLAMAGLKERGLEVSEGIYAMTENLRAALAAFQEADNG